MTDAMDEATPSPGGAPGGEEQGKRSAIIQDFNKKMIGRWVERAVRTMGELPDRQFFEKLTDTAVDERYGRMFKEELERRLAEEVHADLSFDAGTLEEMTAGQRAEPAARVNGLVPWEAAVLLVAQRKAGKTTLALNYAKALLTGEPFLGVFPVVPVTG